MTGTGLFRYQENKHRGKHNNYTTLWRLFSVLMKPYFTTQN